MTYADGAYKYVPKADANKWNALEISMNGKVFEKTVDADAAAPKLEVTWAYEKDTTTAVDTSDQVEYVDGPSASISKTGLITITGLTAEKNYKSMKVGSWDVKNDVTWQNDSWNESTGGTLKVQLGSSWLSSGGTLNLVVTLTDGSTINASVTLD